ncbi:MAG: hypothetical protein ACFB20_00270 [Opitutales bacterium]
METLLEFLIPAIVILLFFLGKIFGNDQEADEARPPARPQSPAGPTEATDDRTRQIQEEIRRKIAERRAAQEGEAPAASPPTTMPPQPVARQMPPPVPAAPAAPESPPRGLSRYEDVADNRWDEPAAQTETFSVPESSPATPPSSVAAFQAQLEQQRRRAEEARRRLEQAREERARQEREARFKDAAQSWGHTPLDAEESLARSVQRMLRHPNATRQAFVLYEILGTPVGLRSPEGGQRPKWEE